jgi:signal transduction histidine kinase
LQPLNLNDLVHEVLPLVRNKGLASEVPIRLELEPALPVARGDRVQLAQVVLNLVINALDAIEAAPAKPRDLVVRTARTDAGGVNLAVRDSGTGIPCAELDRIFDSFFTTKPNGMGMGLSVCRSIVQAHAGRIWATNNPDRGATLQFDLPGMPEAKP